jgi:glycerol-3-phosphate acyltransferase PlsY
MHAMFISYLAFAFLLGSIPFGLIIGTLFYAQDIRTLGSKNIGMTNVWRTIGLVPAIFTLIGDLGKGYLAISIAMTQWSEADSIFWVACSALLGHCYSILLSGKGGKGVATGAGILFALDFRVGLLSFIIWALGRYLTKKSSLSAFIALSFLLPLVYWLQPSHLVAAFAMIVIILWRHKENITRLRAGTES